MLNRRLAEGAGDGVTFETWFERSMNILQIQAIDNDIFQGNRGRGQIPGNCWILWFPRPDRFDLPGKSNCGCFGCASLRSR
jgi:hypothetical protein